MCLCAGFWTDRWILSAPVVCRNQGGTSVHSMGGSNRHTLSHTRSLCGRDKDNDSEKHLCSATLWQRVKVCVGTMQTCILLTEAPFLSSYPVPAI